MRLLFSILRRVAPTDLTLLVQGETGTGKELVARSVHEHSTRRDGPFVVVDATSLSSELIHSELFGHEKGAFTGAVARRRGAFECAHEGTLFLDEVGELPLELQGRFLRVLEQSSFSRLGSEEPITVDVRVIAATNQNLRAMVRIGDFRLDLYHRLNELAVEIPPLRERLEDIPLLTEHFLEEVRKRLGETGAMKTFSTKAVDALFSHDWEGNLRELRNYLARALALSPHAVVTPENLPPFMKACGLLSDVAAPEPVRPAGADLPCVKTLRDIEITMIQQAMTRAKNNKAKAARQLGLAESTLRHRLKRYGL